jgi:predicted RNA-binding protein with PIN domain
MRYFLDGYNFIFRFSEDIEDLKKSRELFIKALAYKNQKHALDITLFFDAKKNEPYPAYSQFEGLHILFCQSYASADEAIIDEVSRAPHPKEITVVSGDKPLLSQTSFFGAKSLAPSAFLALLAKKPKLKKTKPPLPKKKPTPESEEKTTFSTLEEYYLFHFQKNAGSGIPLKKGSLHRKEDEIESEFLRWLRLFSEDIYD